MKPFIYIVFLTVLAIAVFTFTSSRHFDYLFKSVENQYRQGLVNIVSVARHAVEPVLARVRSGEISREQAISEVRSMVRNMTYEDRDGKNYVFMSSYDGIMLVQPFEPEKEMTNQWDFKDVNGVYVVQELVKAAKTDPEGSFVSYHYLLPGVHDVQEKMAYVVGLQDLECYLGTGMYMAPMVRKQKKIAAKHIYTALLVLITVLVPICLSLFVIHRRNRRLVREIETRKQAEAAVKQSKKLLGDILRAASDFAIIASDTDGTVTVFNHGAERMLGYTAGEVIGCKNVMDFHLPEEMSAHGDELSAELGHPVTGLEIVAEKLEAEGSISREWTYLRKDGTMLPVLLVNTAVRSEDGAVTGYLGIGRDLTHRKETERALAENEIRLGNIARNIPGGVYRFSAGENGKWALTYSSKGMTEIFGLPSEIESKYDEFFTHVHEDDKQRFIASIRRAVDTLTPWKFEGRFVKPSGEVLWFLGMSSPIRNEASVVFDGIMLDITEQKRVEEKLRLSEQKFTKVFMTVPDCIAITRMEDGQFKDVNPAAETMVGWRRDDIIGHTSTDTGFWITPEDREFLVDELEAGRDVLHREIKFRRKDGALRTGVYSARSVHIEDEPCILFILQDITDRRRLEEERRKLEQQLSYSQKMDAIGRLAGGVAHDFNNMLMGIKGYVGMMLMDCTREHPHYEKLQRIEERVERGAELTKQLLGFARQGKYEPKILSINELIRNSARFFIETRKEIEAKMALPEEIRPVEADAGQMEQVLLNIFINAGNAMPRGGRLEIETENVTLPEKKAVLLQVPPGDYVKISISDSGSGIDETVISRIFDPFFTTRSDQGGTGLGLASAYGIIRNHGGSITAESNVGEGACFTIYLPASVKKIESEAATLKNEAIIEGAGHILVVDDETVILEVATVILGKLGYTVHPAETAEEAIEYFRKGEKIDLVILDMILKGTSGPEILKELKAISPDVKVLLSSGYGLQGEVKNAMAMGCIGFIQKPYNFAQLSRAVHQAISLPERNPGK